MRTAILNLCFNKLSGAKLNQSDLKPMRTTVALAGGVGAAKLLRGLIRVVRPRELLIIGNTGDDLELYGLHISPDLDIVMYTLAGIVDETRGWGIKDDTYNALSALGELGFETWFRVGDKDLATHIIRTKLLKNGMTLSQATAQLCRMLRVKNTLTPMTDQTVRTKIISHNRTLDFQEYFVKNQTKDEVTNVICQGASKAEPAPSIIEALSRAERIIICPSNPILSIAPILAIPKIRQAMQDTEAQVVAISPIISGKTIKGPADRIMATMGYKASAEGVAEYYADLIDRIIIDRSDAAQKTHIQRLGLKVAVTNTVMKNLEDSIHLAKVAMKPE
jgi:LPPG:FO 2-phospho-L-lactate transferase